MSEKLSVKRGEEESGLSYVERILSALMSVHEIQGVALAIKTRSVNSIFTAKGNPPHLMLADDESEWNDYWGR